MFLSKWEKCTFDESGNFFLKVGISSKISLQIIVANSFSSGSGSTQGWFDKLQLANNEGESDIKEEAMIAVTITADILDQSHFKTQVFVMLAYPKMLRLNLTKKKCTYWQITCPHSFCQHRSEHGIQWVLAPRFFLQSLSSDPALSSLPSCWSLSQRPSCPSPAFLVKSCF